MPKPSEIMCPKCGQPMWDNRFNKQKPTAPDLKCSNKECKWGLVKGARVALEGNNLIIDGSWVSGHFVTGIWLSQSKKQEFSNTLDKSTFDQKDKIERNQRRWATSVLGAIEYMGRQQGKTFTEFSTFEIEFSKIASMIFHWTPINNQDNPTSGIDEDSIDVKDIPF
jgi:hypothetical protein